MDVIYPVDSMYFSTSSTSPASSIGGTWVQIKGAVLAATGNNSYAASGSYGGKLALDINSLPVFYPTIYFKTSDQESKGYGLSKASTFQDRALVWSKEKNGTLKKLFDSTGGGRISCPIIILATFGEEPLKRFTRGGL